MRDRERERERLYERPWIEPPPPHRSYAVWSGCEEKKRALFGGRGNKAVVHKIRMMEGHKKKRFVHRVDRKDDTAEVRDGE